MLAAVWVAYLATLALLALYGAHRLYLTTQYWRLRRRRPRPALVAGELPVVTVQLPLYNERYVAERLIAAVAALDWPRARLQIQVLDDSDDDTTARCAAKVAQLKAEGYDIEHVRRPKRVGFKAGALAYGLARAKGSLILVLDADFVPPAGLLRTMAGYFERPEVGMVQVRWEHLNRDLSLLTRVQALLLDGHFVIEQTARSCGARFFNFNGTAGLWRREAIVDAGGWHHDTLTEDLDLSYRALLRGWRFIYLGDEAAPAELPADINAFKSQQFRWAKGSVEVARKLLPTLLRARLPWQVKLEGFFHLTQNVPYLLMLLLIVCAAPALALRPGSAAESLWLHAPVLLGTALTLGTYCAAGQRALGRSAWRTLALLPALVALTVGISLNQARAVIEGALGYRTPFVRTPKHGVTDRMRRWRQRGYRGGRGAIPLLEIGFAIYVASFFALACAGQRWTVAASLLLFALGFGYVGVCSLARR